MKRIFYTDGSSKGNPGPGGFGVVELTEDGKEVVQIHREYCDNTTNNREELKAILYVVEMAATDLDNEYIIYSDSAYCVNSLNVWMHSWARNNWMNSKKKPVENLDLIKPLWKLFNKMFFNVTLEKIAGHDGVIGNELADRLATNKINEFYTLLKIYSIKCNRFWELP